MISFIIISDPHCHNYGRYSRRLANNMSSRLQTTLDVLASVPRISKETGIKNVLVPGDIFDAKGKIPVIVINAVFREFSRWNEMGLNVGMTSGNHDHAIRSGEEHGLSVFDEFVNFTLFDEPTYQDWDVFTDDGDEAMIDMVAVPYRDRLDARWFTVDPASEQLKVCMAHGLIEGAAYSPSGSMEVDHEGLIEFDAIQKTWLERFDMAAVGHIHYPQQLGTRNHILIPGMPWQQWYHERFQERGVWIARATKIGEKWSVAYEKIVDPDIPVFVDVVIAHDGDFEVVDGLSTVIEGNIVVATPMDRDVSITSIKDAEDLMYQRGASYVDLQGVDGADDIDDAPRIQINAGDDSGKVLRTVLGSSMVSLDGFTPQTLYPLGLELLKNSDKEEKEWEP